MLHNIFGAVQFINHNKSH